MDTPRTICHDDRRRKVLREDGRLTGIDYVEIDQDEKVTVDGETITRAVLRVYLLSRLPDDPGAWIDAGNITVTEHGTDATCHIVEPLRFENAADDEYDDWIEVTIDCEGSFLGGILRLQGNDEHPLDELDPRYAAASFSIAADDSPAELDCLTPLSCPPDESDVPDLDYLAKDYASFRQLLLDRLATTLPDWRDHQSPDLYLTIIEALAYHADHLSYAQDAVATESHLDTARFRTSVRRHVRLVDYGMHEGCNARAWLTLEVSGNPSVRVDQVQFLTRLEGIAEEKTVLLENALRDSPRSSYEIFEPLPEKGWEEIDEHDITNPEAVGKRILDEESPEMSSLRSLLGQAVLNELSAAIESDDPRLVDIELTIMRRALDDPDFGLVGSGHALATRRYGTPNALRGTALRRHNRCKLPEVFPEEIAEPARYRFFEAHNRIPFYTWHQAHCCLPKGATCATLHDEWLDRGRRRRALDTLAVTDVLILEEVINPRTGNASDADPSHRHPVRLTSITRLVDPLGDIPVVRICWAPEDALPFALTISAIGPAPQCALLEDVSVALGNVVLVDHGETVRKCQRLELLDGARTFLTCPFDPPNDIVPSKDVDWCCVGEHRFDERPLKADRYAPRLPRAPLVFAEPLDPGLPPARDRLEQQAHEARPQVALFSPIEHRRPWMDVLELKVDAGEPPLYERWLPRLDLLSSDADDRHFVVEIDDLGVARIRFGDGVLGAGPEPDTRYLAWYRVGGGPSGNVGRDSIRRLLLHGSIDGGEVLRVRNPLPAVGGTAPERVAEARLRAPHAFRTELQRAVTLDDYAAIALREFRDQIQRAAATFDTPANNRSQVKLSIDPAGTTSDSNRLLEDIEETMQRFVRIGHQLDVVPAEYVPIDLSLEINLAPHHQWGAVKRALLDRFSNRRRPDGGYGFFHPDQVTFGTQISVSAIVAAALDIPGVHSARVTKLAKHGPGSTVPASDVFEPENPYEIVRLDNDPKHPEHGVLTITKEPAS
jgi:hypothetical protein